MSNKRAKSSRAGEGELIEIAEAAPDGPELPELSGLDPASLAVTARFRVALPSFEGPLDLLLHLIREHRIDIFDIPIALITDKYLEMLKAMKELDLDIAGEFLLMAATLAHIKSRVLLPSSEPLPEEEQEQVDPREELVRRLLTYQKYKDAAEQLAGRGLLDRDVFARRSSAAPIAEEGPAGLIEVSIFKLVEALARLMREVKSETPHQVFLDRVSLSETITSFIERLRERPELTLREFVLGAPGEARDRYKVVVAFLAVLELCRMRLVRVLQEENGGELLVRLRNADVLRESEQLDGEQLKDDYR